MNRCLAHFFSLFLLALMACAPPALAQFAGRPFPPQAQRGVMQVTQPPALLLNGQAARFSPGARIRGTNNLLLLSASLVGQTLPVMWLPEPQGLVHEVWVLTPEEAAATERLAPRGYITTTPTTGPTPLGQ